jgi:hypothetical protein
MPEHQMLKGTPVISRRPSNPSKVSMRNSLSSVSSISESQSEFPYGVPVSEGGAELSSCEVVEQSEQIEAGGITWEFPMEESAPGGIFAAGSKIKW